MVKIETKKLRALKLAPWWKRLLAYTLDNALLFILLVFFITGIYGKEFAFLLENITEYGGLSLLEKESSFTGEELSQMSSLTPNEQNMTYWFYVVQNKYTKSIFIINQILSSLYFILFWWSTGQTIGAKIFKIKVITPTNEKIPFFSVLSRTAALKLIEMAWGFPMLIVVNPMLKQRLHDSLSRTVVIEEFTEEEEEEIIEQLEKSQIPDSYDKNK